MFNEKIKVGIFNIKDRNYSFMDSAISKKGYKIQKLINNNINNYNIYLYYQAKKTNPKWKEFFYQIVNKDEEILIEDNSKNESFVLLVVNAINNNMYAIAGGNGYFVIQEYIYEDFGIDIVSRLIKKEDKIIISTKEISIVGSILGSTKHFRNDYNLFENDSFGNIYNELTAKLNNDLLISKFGFTKNDIKRKSVCIAKSSFKINKSISMEQLFKIINGCESIISLDNSITINNVVKLTNKKNKALIQGLESKLFKQLWDRYNKPEDRSVFAFDLCDKNFERYFTTPEFGRFYHDTNSQTKHKVVPGKMVLVELSSWHKFSIVFPLLRFAN